MVANIADLVTRAERSRPGVKADSIIARLRSGDTNPVGAGDVKTGSPGTYRPVGPTCPATCPQADACYATTGNVALHQRTASADVAPAVRAAAVAIVAAWKTGKLARLHVSGDYGRTAADVDAYCEALISMLHAYRAANPKDTREYVAWTYTHSSWAWQRWSAKLRAAGVYTRRSDYLGKHGAIVVQSWGEVRTLRETEGRRVARCPAQISDTDCAACTLCWSRPDVTIAFLAHGPKRRRAATLK